MSARRFLPGAVLGCALALAAPALGAAPGQGHPPPWHTSDGSTGPTAPQIPAFLRAAATTSHRVRWRVAPGVTYSRWERNDARGPIRAHLLNIDPGRPGVALGYASGESVRATAPVLDLLAQDSAVAGVNGDFYDIGVTGAPLGLGRDRERGLLNARESGWNSSFYLDRDGAPRIGTLTMLARIDQHPRIDVTNLNSAAVVPGGIGVYTHGWGRTAGYHITDGQRRRVRMVTVRDGRVQSSRRRLAAHTTIPESDLVLVGRGTGAGQLRGLRVGSRLSVTWHLDHRARMAISGDRFLVRDGVPSVVDDREMHPRTAVGIDEDTGHVLLVVIDGRRAGSRGYTLVEMAHLMLTLGADDALNLDGGGSSTMVARKRSGRVGVVNTPSDGFPRSVANALEVTYTPPV